MGTQIGNATPEDAVAAVVDENVEDNSSDAGPFAEVSWASDGSSEF